MNIDMYLGIMLLTAILQLLCCSARKKVVRLLPVIVILLLQILLFVWYAVSRWTNWACLILMLILLTYLAACGVTWATYSIIKRKLYNRRGDH